jgi:hypothetical protein
MHRALLPKGNSRNGDCLDAFDDEQDDADEE